MMAFGREICGDLEAALTREWLETNGLGGFGSSTVVGLNTRRYHGLLIAASKPPLGRLVLLAKLEADLRLLAVVRGKPRHCAGQSLARPGAAYRRACVDVAGSPLHRRLMVAANPVEAAADVYR